MYSTGKLRSDSEKLANLTATVLPSYPNIENYVLLWIERTTKANTDAELRKSAAIFSTAAVGVTEAKLDHVLTSSVDLFSSKTNEPRVATLGLFEVHPSVSTLPES